MRSGGIAWHDATTDKNEVQFSLLLLLFLSYKSESLLPLPSSRPVRPFVSLPRAHFSGAFRRFVRSVPSVSLEPTVQLVVAALSRMRILAEIIAAAAAAAI